MIERTDEGFREVAFVNVHTVGGVLDENKLPKDEWPCGELGRDWRTHKQALRDGSQYRACRPVLVDGNWFKPESGWSDPECIRTVKPDLNLEPTTWFEDDGIEYTWNDQGQAVPVDDL